MPKDRRKPHLLSSLGPVLALVAILLSLATPSIAQTNDPGTIYLDAYLMVEDAEKLEAAGQFGPALRKYSDAKLILDAIARDFPHWRPEVVAYRRKKVNEAIGRCRAHVPAAREGGDPLGYSRTPQKPYVPPPGADTGSSLLRQKDARIDQLTEENKRLLAGVQSTQARMESTLQSLRTSQAAQKSLVLDLRKTREQLETSNNNPEVARRLQTQIDRLTGELEIANEALEKANERNATLRTDLQRAEDMIASLKTERNELRHERERMEELLKSAEESDVKELLTANVELKKELQAARAQARDLASAKKRDEAQISALRDRLKGVEQRLADLQKENADFQERIAGLSSKLRATEASLKGAIESGGAGQGSLTNSALDENRALRDILKRQIMQQAYRQQTKQLVMAELQRRGAASQELMAQIEELAGNGAMLTPREQELLRDSLLSDLGDEGGTILQPGQALQPAEYPEILGHNDGTLSPIGLNENLTGFARGAAMDFAAGNYEACQNAYRQILEIVPGNVYALRNLGIVAMRMNKNQEAEELFKRAIALKSSDGYSHFILGVFYYRSGFDDLAMRSMDQGLEISPRNAKAHHYLGAICIKRGLRERARQEFQSVVALDPTFGDAYYNLAYLYVTDVPPRLDLAREYYLQAQKNGTAEDRAMTNALGS